MGRILRPIGLATLLVGALMGCHKSSLRPKDPPDPLLVTKKPVQGRAAATGLASQQDATPPPVPGKEHAPTSVRRDTVVPVQPVHLRLEPMSDGR
jgi:hypothetical protein